MSDKEAKVTKTTHSVMELDFGYMMEDDEVILKELMERGGIINATCEALPRNIEKQEHHDKRGGKTIYNIAFDNTISDEAAEAVLANLKERLEKLKMLQSDLAILNAAKKKGSD